MREQTINTNSDFEILSGLEAQNFFEADNSASINLLGEFFKERNPEVLQNTELLKHYKNELIGAIRDNRTVFAILQETKNLIGQVYFTEFHKPAGEFFSTKVDYPIKEVHRGYVLPEYRGSKIYSQLMRPAILKIAHATEGSVITATVVDAVAAMCTRSGYTEHPNRELWLAYGQNPDSPNDCPPEMALELENYRFFVKQNSQSK